MKILVGSTYFFKSIAGFKSKDIDYVVLVSNPIDFKYVRQTSFPDKYCLFEWKKMNVEEFIKYTLETKLPMTAGKFLIPEFNNQIGFTIEHLKRLQPIFEKIDKKHTYEKIIFDAYIENNDFILTDDQRMSAYEEYKKSREII